VGGNHATKVATIAVPSAYSGHFGALAEFERDLIQERTHAGLAAARARGRTGGRPKKLADPKQLALARALHDGGQTDVATICATLGISRATLYRAQRGRIRLIRRRTIAASTHCFDCFAP